MRGRKEESFYVAKKLIAILVVFSIIIANYALVGGNIAEAVAEEFESLATITKGSNIAFDAYFEDGDSRHEKELNINEEETLNLQIEVKDKVTLPYATIKIEDANFTIDEEKLEDNRYIKNINTETNEIELNNVSSNNNVEIHLPIKFKKEEKVNFNYFDKEINITLNGKYGDMNQKEKDLEGKVTIKPRWTSEADIEVEQSIEKYFSLGGNGTLLQQTIKTRVKDDVLPVSEETIQTDAPIINDEKPQKVTVLINGEAIDENKVEYNEEENKVKISYNNIDDNEGKIDWEKSKKEYTVIYKYAKAVELKETAIKLNTKVESKVYTKEETIEKEDTQELPISPIGNMVTMKTKLEGDVYKGYLYNNEAKEIEYTETNEIDVSYIEGIENINLQTNNNIYVDQNGKGVILADNIRYTQTKINKDEFLSVFGEKGTITIKGEGETVYATINSEMDSDEEGFVVVPYGDATKNITIQASKPQKEGKVTIINTKALNGAVSQNRNIVKRMTKLAVGPEVTTNMTTEGTMAQLELKESSTQAELEVSQNSLSTAIENKNIEIKATLNTSQKDQDLYQNPKLTIELPTDVTSIKVNSINKLFGDEFTQVKPSQGVVNGKQAIIIELIGEQVEHKDKGTDGTVIDINADLILNPKAISKKDVLKMTYTNEKANQYKDGAKEGTEQVEMNVVAPKGLITTNNITALGIETVGEQEGVKKTIDRGANEQEVTIENEIINNNEEEIKDVKILGTFGTEGKVNINDNEYENNISSALRTGLSVQANEKEGRTIKVYYSENAEATEDLENKENAWQETITDASKVKKYLIELSNMSAEESIKANYNIVIPANLKYDQHMFQGYTAEYKETSSDAAQKIAATTIAVETEKQANAEIRLSANVGKDKVENGTEVNRGEIIEYTVEVENTGDKDIENATITVEIPEETALVESTYNETDELYEFIEKEDSKEEFIIDQLKQGDKLTKEFKVRVKKDAESEKEITQTAKLQYEETIKTSNEIKSKVSKESGDLEISIHDGLVQTDVIEQNVDQFRIYFVS